MVGMSKTKYDLNDALWFRDDALAAGMTDSMIRKMIRSKEWARVRWGAYTSSELWAELGAEDRHRLRSRAVLHRGHESSILSHVSAALEYGVPVWGIDLTPVHVTRQDGRGGRKEAGVVHHRGALTPAEVTEVAGVPVTTPTRTAIEVAAMTTLESGLITVNGLLHAKLLTPAELAAAAQRTARWPGSLTTDLLVRLADPRIESAAESRFVHLAWSQQLPRPEPQVEVYDESGLLIGRVDFALPHLRAYFEIDGREKYYRYRREGESVADFVLREKKRQEQITLLTGWTCIRLTWDDLNHPERTARRIRQMLQSINSGRTLSGDSSLRY